MPKLKIFLEKSWLLMVASFCFGLLIAGADAAWRDKINYNLNVYKVNRVAQEVLPEATSFQESPEKIEVETGSGKKVPVSLKTAKDAYDKDIGWLFVCQGKGYSGSPIRIILAVDMSFAKITGYGVLEQSETPTLGDRIKSPYFRDQFIGAPAGDLVLAKTGDSGKVDSEIVALTGATISSRAVVDLVNNYLAQIKKAMQEKGMLKNG
jgi:electron transport complex protein RnfG